MHLSLVTLPVVDVAAWAAYGSDTLGLPVTVEHGAARVRVGPTVLELRPADTEPAGPHHLALTVPTGSFDAAKTWLTGGATLLDRDGQDEFEGPAGWNSRSVYFGGPERSVLELIERRDLAGDERRSGSFGPGDLLALSEVGIAVADVAAAVQRLASLGVHPYANPPAESFAALGDVHGLLILVRPGRPWLPTTDREARSVPTHVETAEGLELRFPG
jgi:catechol-2,3-dioxygenase